MEEAIQELVECLDKIFEEHKSTGKRQLILAGLFQWLKENEDNPMSPGEVRSSIRKGFVEVLEYKF